MNTSPRTRRDYARGTLSNQIEFDSGRPHSTEGGNGVLFRGKLHISSHPDGSPSQYSYVALKRVRWGTDDEDDVKAKRIRNVNNEADLWECVHHPNLLRFLGVLVEADDIYLISPFAPHGSLPSYIRANPDSNRPMFLWQIAAGIAYLHSRGMCHGDVKGPNVVVFDGPTAKICDFGLSKLIDGNQSTTPQYSLPWTSPERWNGEPRSYASDVYAFGMTIYEILTGKTPYGKLRHENFLQRILINRERPPTDIASSSAGVSYALLWELARRCWQTESAGRPRMEYARDVIARMEPVRGTFAAADSNDLQVHSAPPTPLGASAVLSSDDLRRIESLPRAISANHRAHRLNAPTPTVCFPGTRTAVLQRIYGWVETMDSNSSSVFWLNGTPGTGKTTIAKTLAEHAERDGILGASFFFSRHGADEVRNGSLVIPTIAFQLAQAIPDFKFHLASALAKDPEAAHHDALGQLQRLMAGPMQAIKPSKPVVVVLDALDECDVRDAVTLSQLLLAMMSDPATPHALRLFVTSRSPNPALDAVFQGTQRIATLLLDDVQQGVIQADIERYLVNGLRYPPPHPSLPADWISTFDVEELVKRCGNRFVYASAILNHIRDDSFDSHRDQLESVLNTNYGTGANGRAELEDLCGIEAHYTNLGPVGRL